MCRLWSLPAHTFTFTHYRMMGSSTVICRSSLFVIWGCWVYFMAFILFLMENSLASNAEPDQTPHHWRLLLVCNVCLWPFYAFTGNMAVFIITWNLSVFNVFYFQPRLDNLTVVSDRSNCKIATSVTFYPVQRWCNHVWTEDATRDQ